MAITGSLVRLACIACGLATCATTAFAQTGVRVTRDRSSIWRHDFQSPAAIVDAGTMLIVVGRRIDWIEVVVPGEERATGFILKGYVEAAPGAEPDGTPDTITMLPMALTAGWRFTHEHVTPYVGASTGRLFYKEAPSSADADEIVDNGSRATTFSAASNFDGTGWPLRSKCSTPACLTRSAPEAPRPRSPSPTWAASEAASGS